MGHRCCGLPASSGSQAKLCSAPSSSCYVGLLFFRAAQNGGCPFKLPLQFVQKMASLTHSHASCLDPWRQDGSAETPCVTNVSAKWSEITPGNISGKDWTSISSHGPIVASIDSSLGKARLVPFTSRKRGPYCHTGHGLSGPITEAVWI